MTRVRIVRKAGVADGRDARPLGVMRELTLTMVQQGDGGPELILADGAGTHFYVGLTRDAAANLIGSLTQGLRGGGGT